MPKIAHIGVCESCGGDIEEHTLEEAKACLYSLHALLLEERLGDEL